MYVINFLIPFLVRRHRSRQGNFMLCFFTTHCSLRLIVRSELDVPTFATRRLHACHHARAPSAESGTVGEKYPGILPKCRIPHLGFFYMP